MTQGQRGAVPRTRGRLIRAFRRHGQAGHDRQRLGVPQPPLAPRLRRPRAAPYPHQAVHAADRPRVQPEDPAERFIQTSLCESAYAHPSRPRTTVPPRSSLGLSITIRHGLALPWRTSRPPPGLANRRSSVRPPAPFLRSDLPSPTAGRRRTLCAGWRWAPAALLAPTRRTGHAPTEGNPMLVHLNNVSWKRQLVH
jgi:hypothetical protein